MTKTDKSKNIYVFGPVPSRRLGISLGVDLTPFKTCTLDCLYCECGRTTRLQTERSSFIDPILVKEQLTERLAAHPRLDYITFSGSGEPLLSLDVGEIIAHIKTLTQTPVAVLTNGTLLNQRDVLADIADCDLLLPSLDAADLETFSLINRPSPMLDFDAYIEGLIRLKDHFKGPVWMEVFLAKGLNDDTRHLGLLHGLLTRIRADKVQLNSLDRPPAYSNILPLGSDELEGIARSWADLPVEVIKRTVKASEIDHFSHNLRHNLLNTIRRRPLTLPDLMQMTGKEGGELRRYLDILEHEKLIKPIISGDQIHFAAVEHTVTGD
jgi:wyosine [tRNA(Phe)-imidazoG37] synthetase (radical SAM superfamily)